MSDVKIVRMNERGQIVLPVEFRRVLKLEKNSEMQLQLREDGGIEMRPVVHVPISYFVENSDSLRPRFLKSFEQMQRGEVFDNKETMEFLESKFQKGRVSNEDSE